MGEFRLTMEEENEFPKKRKRTCEGQPCLICDHRNCGDCPDCSPEIPEWTN